MKQKITTINGVDIFAETTDNGIFVPVKPICEAIGIDFNSQRNKSAEEEILSSTVAIIATVGADGKEREMVCLPLQYVYGWLFTINPGKVAPEVREVVSTYRRECYDALYRHFYGRLKRQADENEAEARLLCEINNRLTDEKEAKRLRKQAEEQLERLRAERLNPQQTLF